MLTPLDIHNKEFSKIFRGYNSDEVDDFLDLIIKDYEHLYRENLDLKEQLEKNKEILGRYKEIEDTLHNTMILAQQTADEVKRNAEKEGDLILREAKNKAEAIIGESKLRIVEANTEYENLRKKVNKSKAQFRSFLMTQLELIDLKEEDHVCEAEIGG